MIKSVVFLLTIAVYSTSAFNLAPLPYLSIKAPFITSKQNRSSYFGFTVNLRKSHVLVGAPRAQSSTKYYENITEPGAIFKCDLKTQKCASILLENNKIDAKLDKRTQFGKIMDFQLLGYSMDGFGYENNKFIACAPNQRSDASHFEYSEYLVDGACYWISDTNVSSKVHKINTLEMYNLQLYLSNMSLANISHAYGQSGFSVHVSDDDETFVIGSPGSSNWKGCVMIHRTLELTKFNKIYETVVLNTVDFRYNNSNYGYSVSSAKFLKNSDKKFYVVSSPNMFPKNLTTESFHGMVFIFEIKNEKLTKIDKELHEKVYFYKMAGPTRLTGSQFGEYFGYSLLCEDFNGDGYIDIAISAPFYSQKGTQENGAVYVFITQPSNRELKFKEPIILTIPNNGNGRFGTSLSKIGDVNLDGYNDLLVSSPHENDGAVYLFLGMKTGISEIPSQRIEAPQGHMNEYNELNIRSMFGYGLSRGVDIDGNGYPDIIIGSPNGESIHVYRSYPSIRVFNSLTLSKNELKLENDVLIITFCAYYESKTELSMNIDLVIKLSVDKSFNRVSLNETHLQNTVIRPLRLTKTRNCYNFTTYVKPNLADIFEHVIIKVDFDVARKILQNSTEFCDSCFTLDPNYSGHVNKSIKFFTGCFDEICAPEISLTGSWLNVNNPFILGSHKTIFMRYLITNSGEPAYVTQLNITMSTYLAKFSKVPSTCKQEQNMNGTVTNSMICEINSGKAVKQNEKITIDVAIDVTYLHCSSFIIRANATSKGFDENPENNEFSSQLNLAEFSQIDLSSRSSTTHLTYSKDQKYQNVLYKYEIFNNGPSNVKELTILALIPVIFQINSKKSAKLVRLKEINISSAYGASNIEAELRINDEIMNYFGHDSEEIKQENETFFHQSELNHTTKIDESIKFGKNQQHHEKMDQNFATLGLKRTIYTYCDEVNKPFRCIQAEMKIQNFSATFEPINIMLNFTLDLSVFDEIFAGDKNIFVYRTFIKLLRTGDDSQKTLKISSINPHTIIYGQVITKTSIWIYVAAGIAGFLVFVLLCYTMYKLGFFTRSKKEELQELKRQSLLMDAECLKKWEAHLKSIKEEEEETSSLFDGLYQNEQSMIEGQLNSNKEEEETSSFEELYQNEQNMIQEIYANLN